MNQAGQEHKPLQSKFVLQKSHDGGRDYREEEGGDRIPGMANGIVDNAKEAPSHSGRWRILNSRIEGRTVQVSGRFQKVSRIGRPRCRVPTRQEQNRPQRQILRQKPRCRCPRSQVSYLVHSIGYLLLVRLKYVFSPCIFSVELGISLCTLILINSVPEV